MAGNDLELYDDVPETDHAGSPYQHGPEHVVTRTSREVFIHLDVELTVEIVEPPNVMTAEIQSMAKKRVNDALNTLGYGVTTGLRIRANKVSDEAAGE